MCPILERAVKLAFTILLSHKIEHIVSKFNISESVDLTKELSSRKPILRFITTEDEEEYGFYLSLRVYYIFKKFKFKIEIINYNSKDNFIWLNKRILENINSLTKRFEKSSTSSNLLTSLEESEMSLVFTAAVTILHELIHFKVHITLL